MWVELCLFCRPQFCFYWKEIKILGRAWYSPRVIPVHIYRITASIRLEKTSGTESNLWLNPPMSTRVWHWVPRPVLNSLGHCQLAYSVVRRVSGLVCTLITPLVACLYVDNTVIPVLPHTPLFIHSASPCISSLLYFALTYIGIWMVNYHWCRAAAAAQGKGFCLKCCHHNLLPLWGWMWLCKTRHSKWLTTRKCAYLIILLVVAAQSDLSFNMKSSTW